MSFESLTQDQISDLIKCEKRLIKASRKITINKVEMGSFDLVATDQSGYKFSVYSRQNLRLPNDYSCGIHWLVDGERFTFRRYNGSNHNHRNKLQKTSIGFVTHMHTASEMYIRANLKPEGFAEPCDRYKTLNGALMCLVFDLKIIGMQATLDEMTQMSFF